MITLPGKVSFQKIEENLPNLTPDQLNNLFSSVSIAPNSLVGINLKELTKGTDKSFSIRLIKWVEPYRIGGFEWSLFYTEVDHNFKVGDRCFIEGGVYDSDAFINQNIYNAGVDGYKVLYVDRTKIVLDIPFTGDLPTNEEEIDNFVKVYVANTQYEFDFYSQMLSMRDDSGLIENRFQLGLNNFLYLNGNFNSNPTFNSFASDFQPSATSSTLSNSWVIRSTTASTDYFVNITNDVLTNNIVPLLNQSFTQSNSGFFNLEKLRIMNSRFVSGGVTFMNERIYFYNVDTGKWQVDKSYLPTIITKTHFKDGFFSSGSMNSGLYGVHEKRLSYNGSNIQWNLGTTLNVDWLDGVLDSTVYDPESFFTIFDRDALPQIRSNAENNGGAGYNYVFNTEFSGGDVINGNIFNMSTIIGTNSLTQSTLLNYYTGQPQNYSVQIKGGVYYNSDISFATMSNSTFISSYVLNSYIERCKSVNSEIESSVFLNSTWISDRIVKIQAYEESNIVWYDELSNPIDYKMYKFYVNDTNWRRLAEFQNFYIDGIEIKIPSDELLRFFDDKFSFGHWSQSYDVPGSKLPRKVLVQLSTKEENRNSPGQIISFDNDLQPNFDNPLPSIDLFISGGDDFNVGSTTSYPRTFIGETIDIKNGYILDSDFISGLFKDSRWISGNYMNYNADYSFSSGSGYTASLTASTAELTLQIGDRLRPELFGTSSNVSTIAFANGLWYDGIGPNLVKLPDVYKVNGIGGSPSQIFLQDIATQSVLSTILDFSNQTYLKTPGAKNQWNYIHPVKFETSQIFSGVFRRAYFENCLFDNFQFDLEDKDLLDVTNKRKLLVSDVIFDGDGNRIKSGLFQYSHLISGNEDWQNGIFHRGVWNTQIFTYSFSPTSSLTYTTRDVPFKDGIIRNSTWETGNFQNGLFYKNNTNIVGNSQSLSDTRLTYYYEGLNTRWSWKKGEFINGDFERSNFETGAFKDGNFYDSDWFIGVASGGNFGKTNIPFEKTRIWQGTFSNVNVINADFTSGDFLDSNNTQATASIYWNSGVFKKGVFGTKDSPSYSPYLTSNNRSIWKDGIFSGGDFKDSAEWKGGQFDGGRFLSYYWYEPLTPRTPFELNSFTSASFSWQGGKFNGGEFGTGELGKNSTWFTGEFNGGLFKGRYWKDGIFTRGDFLGHASTFSTDSIKSDNSEVLLSRRIDGSENYNEFIRSFNTNYFGYWQGGFVSKVKDKFIKDEKLFTEVERVSTKKKKNPLINFKNMLWNSGTFSAFDGEIDNSVWLDGTFQDGYFVNSAFNPYINLANSKLLFETDLTQFAPTGLISNFIGFTPSSFINRNSDGSYTIETSSPPPLQYAALSQTLNIGETYTIQLEVLSNINYEIYIESFNPSNIIVVSGQTGIINYTFTSNLRRLELIFRCFPLITTHSITFRNLTVYPGTQSGFRITDSCIWENGEAYSSDFYFSKWKQGIFDSFSDSLQGNAWGLVWQNGITKYMNAYNVFWENGIWKNGNWNGSPFSQKVDPICTDVISDGSFSSGLNWNVFLNTGLSNSFGINGLEFTTLLTSPPFGNLLIIDQNSSLIIGNEYTIVISISSTTALPFSIYAGDDSSTGSVYPDSKIVENLYGENQSGTFPLFFTAQSANFRIVIVANQAINTTITISSVSVTSCTETLVYPGFSSDIINNISLYSTQSSATYSNRWFGELHMNDTFKVIGVPTKLLLDEELVNGFLPNGNVTQLGGNSWLSESNTIFPSPFFTSIVGFPLSFIGKDMNSVYDIWNSNNDFLYVTASGTTDIFNQIGDYQIEIEYFVTAKINGSVGIPQWNFNFDIFVGPDDIFPVSEIIILNQGTSLNLLSQYGIPDGQNIKMGWSGIKTKTIPYTVNSIQTGNDLKIKLSDFNPILITLLGINVRLFITKISIEKKKIEYDPATNNQLWQPLNWSPQIGQNIVLPDSNVLSGIIYNANGVSSRFGNGMFRSGIWENGVWNEGWREDWTTIWCENISKFIGGKNQAYKQDVWTWNFTLDILSSISNSYPGFLDDYKVGEKVSVGNIITIDINGNRRLIRDYATIISKGSDKIELQVTINFPIRNIEKDSDEHLIYVSKNVWLNGAFLNGRFKNGVWNNGLFQGFPYISNLDDSHWIDGIFKGGRYVSITSNYTNNNNSTLPYHTGVIQNFEFYDQNVSGKPFEFKFNSWIDVNYYETEGVNINRVNQVYKETSLGFTTSFTENNYYGYPTKDVLSSVSLIRNGFDLNSRTYKLGWKWKEYDNFLVDVGNFVDINEIRYLNANPLTLTPIDQFGINNFINDGWSFDYFGPSNSFAYNVNSIKSNIGNLDSEFLYVESNRVSSPNPSPDSTLNFSIERFNNDNIDIDRLRYNFIEIEAENLTPTIFGGNSNPLIFYNNYPASYSIAANYTIFNGKDITVPINQLQSNSVSKQREYFFNKRSLDMLFFSGASYSVRFNNIRFVETDMIPFTQIATDCFIRKQFALWGTSPVVENPGTDTIGTNDPQAPYPGQWELALPLGETSSNGLFVGNLLVNDSFGLPTWDNFYLIFQDACESYVNKSINVPYFAKSPDIPTDIEFSYVSSINIELSETEIIPIST